MPDRKLSKSLIYKEKSNLKVSKVLNDIKDLGLTYPQKPRNKSCPASVAITSTAPAICRFIFQFPSESTMRDKLVLETT